VKPTFSKAIGRLFWAGCFCVVLAGCARYDITLGNGTIVRAKTKPKLNQEGYYVFKDLTGREVTVNRMRVRQIEPVWAGSKPSSSFLDATPQR
jgi:hypothetical protein